MIRLHAEKARLFVSQGELIASGAVCAYECQFHFDESWDGLDRTAVFQAGGTKMSVPLDGSDCCTIPWEVLENPWLPLYAGVYGTAGGTLVLPTVMTKLGEIRKGASLGEEAQSPTAGIYDQVLAIANEAKEEAAGLRADAEAGLFSGAPGPAGQDGADGKDGADGQDGYTPVRGVDYWTAADQAAVVEAVLAALPMGDEVSY